MDTITRSHLENMYSKDHDIRNAAYHALMAATDQPVDWAYDVWDTLVADLRHRDNHVRAIAAQVLCNLAKSDPENRMLRDFEALLYVTKDERFVTARHCLQALWKIGVAGKPQQEVYLAGLERRYRDCVTEKNRTLIRFDIIQSLRNVYHTVPDDSIRAQAIAWIDLEDDPRYRRKYASVWKGV